MARDFNGTTDRIDYGNVATLTGSAFTLSAWVFPDAVASGNQYIWSIHESGNAATGLLVAMNSAIGQGCLQATRIGTASISRATQAGDPQILTNGSWQHVLCLSDGGTAVTGFRFFRNAVEPSNYTTVAVGPLSGETTHSGSWSTGGRIPDDARNWNGRIAELAIWNTQVSTIEEIAALAKGYSPLLIRPESLLFYTPLIRAQQDLVAGQAGTLDGTSVIEHTRVFYPHRAAFSWHAPAPPVGGSGVGALLGSHRNRLVIA